MVVKEICEKGCCVKRYSDQHKYIHKVGTKEMYAEAIDLIEFADLYEYEETDIDIEE